jgi:hypothetical protein
MGRDEDRFTDVEEFKPERFLNSEGTPIEGSELSNNPIFGLGRRICEQICVSSFSLHFINIYSGPGRFASEAFIWTAVVSILAAFRITKAKDAEGKEIDVERQFTTGISVYVIATIPVVLKLTTVFVRRPVDFPCWFISRSKDREKTIRESV